MLCMFSVHVMHTYVCAHACACACVQLTSPHHQEAPLHSPGWLPTRNRLPSVLRLGQPYSALCKALKNTAAQEKSWLSAWGLCSASKLVGSGQGTPLWVCFLVWDPLPAWANCESELDLGCKRVHVTPGRCEVHPPRHSGSSSVQGESHRGKHRYTRRRQNGL